MNTRHIDAVGLTIVNKPDPHIPWRTLKRVLGQWRYGFALRLGPREWPKYGVPLEDVERILKSMAAECRDTWPPEWSVGLAGGGGE